MHRGRLHEKYLWIFKRAYNRDFKKEEIKLLTKELQESYENAEICYICKDKFENYVNDEKYYKVRDHCNYTGEYGGTIDSIYNLRRSIHKKFPIVLHNEFNYDYHLIIKELAEEFAK